MKRNIIFRLYPTSNQKKKLLKTLDICRQVYNKTLEVRKEAWEKEKKTLSFAGTSKLLPIWKKETPLFFEVYSQVLQNVQHRVDWAFSAFFRRVKKGETPGYPRFKSKNRYDSFCYPQVGFSLLEGSKYASLKLVKIGQIKTKAHRSIVGNIKTCTIKKTPTGKWYAIFSVDDGKQPSQNTTLPTPCLNVVGLDLGCNVFATLSDNTNIKNPRFFKQEQKALAKAQRKKKKKVVARIHERITNKRKDFAHQQSKKLAGLYDVFCVENLQIQKMQQGGFHSLNRSINDVAWNQFINFLSYKAEEAGKKVIKVNPKNTSQTCSRCGELVLKDLSVRIHDCPHCKLHIDRDLNAARNILRLGLQSLALA